MNLNNENERLLTLLRSAENKNALFSTPILPDFDALETSRQVCLLSDEELAASDATVERVESEDKIDDFMRALRGAYILEKGELETPDFLKLGGTSDAERINTFFGKLPEIDPAVLAFATQKGYSTEQAQGWFGSWQTACEQETLKSEAANKVRHALDLRAYLLGTLRYLGYSIASVSE